MIRALGTSLGVCKGLSLFYEALTIFIRSSTIMPIKPGSPPPPKDKHQLLKGLQENRIEDKLRSARVLIDNYERELRKTKGELRKAYECIGHLQQASQTIERFYQYEWLTVGQCSLATKRR
jgi:hypothetical protein